MTIITTTEEVPAATPLPNFITRALAIEMLAEAGCLANERFRNYELESRLMSEFGGNWCINEWCPFNGKFCQWGDHDGRVCMEAPK